MVTVLDLQRFKQQGRRFVMLTAYDYTTASLLDRAGIPCLLVGDTLAMLMLGHPTTLPVTMDEMVSGKVDAYQRDIDIHSGLVITTST